MELRVQILEIDIIMHTDNALTAVLLLAEVGSFQEVAQKMGVSNASLSRYIAQAEEQTGFALFHRSRNNSKLTRAGQEFLPVARRLKSDLERYDQRVQQLRETGRGTLKIGCGPLTSRTLIQPILQDIIQQIPNLQVHVTVSARSAPLDQLQNGMIDVFVGDLTFTANSDKVEILVLEKRAATFVAHVDHDIHNLETCTLHDVFEYPFGCPPLHKHWSSTLIKALGNNKHAVEKVNGLSQIVSDDYGLLTGFLSQPPFIVAGMQETFSEHLALGIVKEIKLRSPITWNICAARKTNETSAALDLFWEGLSTINESWR